MDKLKKKYCHTFRNLVVYEWSCDPRNSKLAIIEALAVQKLKHN